jgi:nucleotide-binding universal stress UspA family protein
MTANRTWLVAARDRECTTPALARAFRLARADDRVVLAHARRHRLLDLLGAGAMRVAAPELSAAALAGDDWLAAICAATAPPPGVTLEAELVDGEAAPALAALADRLDAAAIVAAPARRGALREFALGSTLTRLLREAARPVVVAHGDGAADWRRAAAAVTADPSGLRVVAAAQALAPAAALTLAHAWRVPDEGRLRLHGVDPSRIEAVRDWARASAEGALGDVRLAAPGAALALVEGHAASAILDWGRQAKPDVLFVAAHRGPASQERLLGSVTQFLLYHWPGDLALVP